MRLTQTRLLPDPRPLVERLGTLFFRQVPQGPGVYLMRDAGEGVVYVGKAKSLRKRLSSYRVANPDRMPRRHLRMLRLVCQIEFQQCTDEAAALAREAELLRQLRPRFNRAGTWPGTPRFLNWRIKPEGLALALAYDPIQGWFTSGPLGSGSNYLRAALLRMLWCAVHPERGIAGLPAGWLGTRKLNRAGGHPRSEQLEGYADKNEGLDVVMIPRLNAPAFRFTEAAARLSFLLAGDVAGFAGWVRERAALENHSFAVTIREADLQMLRDFCGSERSLLGTPVRFVSPMA